MAASDLVNAVRGIFRLGDIAYRRANSESIMSKFAAQSNFVNKYQTDIKEYKLNGLYSVATGITFFDGVTHFFYNSEIVGVSFYNGQSGSSGTTTFDIKWKNSSGITQGSIFSTTPKISSSSSDETVAFRNLETGNDFTATGVTLPVLSKTEFLEGESIFMELSGAMSGAANCGITIFYRPID